MATPSNAHSDLIHLFIDGEATETERNVLFGALKDSPELQEEFASAMQLKQAFASDIMKLQPPSYLQSQIAERAGLIIAASSSLATAPVVVNSVSNSLAPVVATGISKGLMTLLIGTSVGVLSTIGIIQMTKQSPENTAPAVIANAPAASQRTPGNLVTPQASGSGDIAQAALTEAAPTGSVKNRLSRTLRSAAPLQALRFPQAALDHSSSTVSRKIDNKDISSAGSPDADISKTEKANDINGGTTENHSAALAETPAMPAIASIDPIVPPSNNIGTERTNRGPIFNGADGFFPEPDWLARISVGIRMMPTSASKLYQGQVNNSDVPAWNNFGWSLKYEFDPFQALAVEGGVETFPVYLVESNGGFKGHHSIGWGGVSYTLSFPLAEVLGIHPDIRALAGMSTAGPIGKISAGLVLQATRQFAFSVDPEYTALFIKENGAIASGSKLGLTGSVIFHF